MSSVIVTPFLRPQILDRLVAMLNYNVVQLVGPKCQELKVIAHLIFISFNHSFI